MKIQIFESIRKELIKNNACRISVELSNGNMKVFSIKDLEESVVMGNMLKIEDWYIEFDRIIAIGNMSFFSNSIEIEEFKNILSRITGE